MEWDGDGITLPVHSDGGRLIWEGEFRAGVGVDGGVLIGGELEQRAQIEEMVVLNA